MTLFFSWWEILTHLSWSLLEIEQDFNPLDSVDTPSVTLATWFYAAFLFIGVILLVNMLIALLSNTYKRVEVSDFIPFFIFSGKSSRSYFRFAVVITQRSNAKPQRHFRVSRLWRKKRNVLVSGL